MDDSTKKIKNLYQESLEKFQYNSCRRVINREQQIPKASVKATVISKIDQSVIEGVVEDQTPFAIGIRFSDFDRFLKVAAEGFLFQFRFGSKLVYELEDPKIIRISQQQKLAIFDTVPNNESGTQLERNSTRFDTIADLSPSVHVKDPLKLDEFFHLKIKEISTTGFLGESSLANKHLFQQLEFKNAEIHFPTCGTVHADCKIIDFREAKGKLRFGGEFLDPDKSFYEILIRYLFLTSSGEASFVEKNIADIREKFGLEKAYKQGLRLTHVQTKEDFEQVMKVRLRAYQNDRPELKNATFEDMTDEFDERSYIVVAKLGLTMAGTLRLVYALNESDRFPVEDLITLPEFITENRKDYLEISKLAVEPFARGSDVRLRLFQKSALETVPEFKGSLCLSTSKNEKYYRLTGAVKITDSVAHPYIKNETLSVFLYKTESFIKGDGMGANVWQAFGKVVTDQLVQWESISKPRPRLRHLIGKPIEDIYLAYLKSKKSKP